MENPYQAPQSLVFAREERNEQLDEAASGQKLVIYAILLYLLSAMLQAVIGPLALIPMLACLIMSWIGVYRIGRGLGYASWLRVFHMALMLVPLVGLLVLATLSARTTSRLKKAGYSVGLLGARV